MSKKRRMGRKRKMSQIIALTGVIGATVLVGVSIARRSTLGGQPTLRDTDTAFSIPTHVGQPAPGFTAIDAQGEPYTFTPGDGRPKAIVFYMGFR